MNLLNLIRRDTPLRHTAMKHGGEYSGPCPICRKGTDRFKVWPAIERWACLGYSHGRAGCDLSGDAIQYLRERDHLSYPEACAVLGQDPAHNDRAQGPVLARGPEMLSVGYLAPLTAPNPGWQTQAANFTAIWESLLWSDLGASARRYLYQRGFTTETIRAAHLGFNPGDARHARSSWGLPEVVQEANRTRQLNPIFLPYGITIPWFYAGVVWRINIRRSLTKLQRVRGEAKYMSPAGFSQGLYNADGLGTGRPVVLVEGEFDALILQQTCGDLVTPVATGSTCGSRCSGWVARLAAMPLVLVAYDNDPNGAGEMAARWWQRVLPNALRWVPIYKDVNDMHRAGLDLRLWIEAALEMAE